MSLQLREELHVAIEEHLRHGKQHLRSPLEVRGALVQLLHKFHNVPHQLSPFLVLVISGIKSLLHQRPYQALFSQKLLIDHLKPLGFVRLQSLQLPKQHLYQIALATHDRDLRHIDSDCRHEPSCAIDVGRFEIKPEEVAAVFAVGLFEAHALERLLLEDGAFAFSDFYVEV